MKIYKTVKIDGNKAKTKIVVAKSKRDKEFKELFNSSDIVENVTPSEEELKTQLELSQLDENIIEFIIKSCY